MCEVGGKFSTKFDIKKKNRERCFDRRSIACRCYSLYKFQNNKHSRWLELITLSYIGFQRFNIFHQLYLYITVCKTYIQYIHIRVPQKKKKKKLVIDLISLFIMRKSVPV